MPQRTTLRSKVNRPRIERAGRAIIRRAGVNGISMRSVAARLDVTPMALYAVVADAAELRAVCVDAVLRTLPTPTERGTPRARLAEWVVEAGPVVARHAGLAEACLAEWPALPAGCRIVDRLLAIAGEMADDPAARAAIALAVLGHVMSGAMAARAARARRRARSLPGTAVRPERAGRFPPAFTHLAACEQAIRQMDPDRQSALELDALLDGIVRRVTSG